MRPVMFLLWGGVLAFCAGCSPKAPPRDFMRENVDRWNGEVARWGGSWDAWEKQLGPFRQDVGKALASQPEAIKALAGLDGFLFFRHSLDVLACGDLQKQDEGRNPFPAIVDFNNQLKSRGVDMLFCPIPVKAAVFPEKVTPEAPPSSGPYVDPYTRKLMLELAGAGVECVDLLPCFMAERDKLPPGSDEPFYQFQDTHWSHRALRTAAHAFAERITAYPWYREISRDRTSYAVKEAACKRTGDIVKMLPETERIHYRPRPLQATQVLKPDGGFYDDDENSPILLLGDSYAGVFHFEDCEHGGLTAHIAREVGVPLDLVLGQGMGPNVRVKWLRYRGGGQALAGKKLVIWAISERDLFNYRSPWAVIQIP
ncbi:MAG: hypothetical protein JW909_12630 [Planctomycetes bacterium]|nr:hypothetical protein [Planctomycetota bacterium]